MNLPEFVVYTEQTSNRLSYILSFIFEDILNASVTITNDFNAFDRAEGIKINYSLASLPNVFQVKPHRILFEETIRPYLVTGHKNEEGTSYFFKSEDGADFYFDVFAAAFYLISRYEEYISSSRVDKHGRFLATESIAFKNNFLQQPIIENWAKELWKSLQAFYQLPDRYTVDAPFTFTPTIDVDMMWKFWHKGFLRNFKNIVTYPIQALHAISNDPFQTFDDIEKLHQRYGVNPHYFILVAPTRTAYDKNNIRNQKTFKTQVQRIAATAEVGVHFSYQSYQNIKRMEDERLFLEQLLHKPITTNRFHYIKFSLPKSYQTLIAAGIQADYSMGYPYHIGFRAGTSVPFYWFDLEKNVMTNLKVHPFAYMDTQDYYGNETNSLSKNTGSDVLELIENLKKKGGNFSSIFHNVTLTKTPESAALWQLYQKMMAAAQPNA